MRRYDFGVYNAFRSVDRYNDGYIDSINLSSFLRQHNQYLTDRELLAIVRRIDTDGDARISYTEFSDFMRVEYNIDRPIEIPSESYKPRAASAQKPRRSHASPLRGAASRTQNLTTAKKLNSFEQKLEEVNFTPEKK